MSETPEKQGSQGQPSRKQGPQAQQQGSHKRHPSESHLDLQHQGQECSGSHRGSSLSEAVSGLVKNLSTLLDGLRLESRENPQAQQAGDHLSPRDAASAPQTQNCEKKLNELSPCSFSEFTLILYDLETTGLGKTKELGITELGAVACIYSSDNEWMVIDDYHNYVLPTQSIDPDVPNKITKQYLINNNAKPFASQCKGEFEAFIKKHGAVKPVILCAHNGKRYDHRILCHHNIHFKGRAVDSLDLFKDASPGRNSYSLKNLYTDMFSAGIPAAHNAMPDVYATLRIMNAMDVEPGSFTRLAEPWSCVQARVAKST